MSDPLAPYSVDANGRAKRLVRHLQSVAHAVGVTPSVARDLERMLDWLRDSPRRGYAIRYLRHAGMQEYAHTINCLTFYYSVHDARPIVFLTDVVPIDGHPLYGQSFDS